MGVYIILANYTHKGIQNIKESPERVDRSRDLAKSLGAEIK